jgi:hypothetical protein
MRYQLRVLLLVAQLLLNFQYFACTFVLQKESMYIEKSVYIQTLAVEHYLNNNNNNNNYYYYILLI